MYFEFIVYSMVIYGNLSMCIRGVVDDDVFDFYLDCCNCLWNLFKILGIIWFMFDFYNNYIYCMFDVSNIVK